MVLSKSPPANTSAILEWCFKLIPLIIAGSLVWGAVQVKVTQLEKEVAQLHLAIEVHKDKGPIHQSPDERKAAIMDFMSPINTQLTTLAVQQRVNTRTLEEIRQELKKGIREMSLR